MQSGIRISVATEATGVRVYRAEEATYLRRRLSPHQSILLECPIYGAMLLETLQGIGRPAQRIGHGLSSLREEKGVWRGVR